LITRGVERSHNALPNASYSQDVGCRARRLAGPRWSETAGWAKEQPTRFCLVGRGFVDALRLVAASRYGLVARGVAWAGCPLLGEALAAVDGLASCRLEGNLGLLATTGAGRGVHLARAGRVAATPAAIVSAAGVVTSAAAVTVIAALRLTGGTAIWAALWLGVAALFVERLLAFRKGKGLIAVAACQGTIAHFPTFVTVRADPRGTVHVKKLFIQMELARRDPGRLLGNYPRGKHARFSPEGLKYTSNRR
jgi:hypothetical protein